jgi:hypothetical protein
MNKALIFLVGAILVASPLIFAFCMAARDIGMRHALVAVLLIPAIIIALIATGSYLMFLGLH